MFDRDSRYQNIPDAVWTSPDGARYIYKQRRFLPRGGRLPLTGYASVAEGERLDLLSARTLGSPLAYWRIADANDAMDPFALTLVPGRRLRIPEPRVEPPVQNLDG